MERTIARRNSKPVDARLIRQVLMLVGGFIWLDESAGWFAIKGLRNMGCRK